MTLPRYVATFNKYVNNRIQGAWAWLLPPYAVVIHHGRRSGRRYRTPVVASCDREQLVVGLLYGEHSDWVQNLLSGDGELVRGGRTYRLTNPLVMTAAQAPQLGGAARFTGAMAANVLVAQVGERVANRTRRGHVC